MYASPPPAEGRTKWNWKKEGTKERGSSVLLEWRRNLRRFRSFVNVLVSSLSRGPFDISVTSRSIFARFGGRALRS
ncbi:MAG: hypothetical protein ACTS5P_01995 [Candidatus Hodgkinia cicadicola]